MEDDGKPTRRVWKMLFLGAVGVSIFLVVYASPPRRRASRAASVSVA